MGDKCEVRDERRRKNKKTVTIPLFWLFPPPALTSIDWRQWCQKDRNTIYYLRENCHLSGYQRVRLQWHKPQETITLLVHETPLNVRPSVAKIRFALCTQMSKTHQEKEGEPFVQTNSKVTIYVIMNLWVVFDTISKMLVNQAFSKPSWKQSKNILPLEQQCLCFSFVSGTFGSKWRASRTE